MPTERLLTRKEAADLLGCSVDTIRRREGKLYPNAALVDGVTLPTQGLSALEPHAAHAKNKKRTGREQPLSLAVCYRLAGHLHPLHQAVFLDAATPRAAHLRGITGGTSPSRPRQPTAYRRRSAQRCSQSECRASPTRLRNYSTVR